VVLEGAILEIPNEISCPTSGILSALIVPLNVFINRGLSIRSADHGRLGRYIPGAIIVVSPSS
jgi:hypothetical protein